MNKETKKNCGSCNFQGEIKQKQIFCYFYNDWHDIGYSCQNFTDYVSGMLTDQRQKIAEAERNRQDSQKRDVVDKQFQKKLQIRGVILGVIGTIVAELILWLLVKFVF
jgi:hypothetical protein